MAVINVNEGTKTWQDSGKTSVDPRAEAVQAQLTDAQKQMLGEENLGSVLNKISDPNFVDPSKKVQGTGSSKMDKDAFFKLMLAQLKNQDPTNPLKNHEMAAQLAQFSSLEQMTNMNTTLNEIKAGSKPVEQFQALNMIGKQISGDAAKILRMDTDKSHDLKFKLPQDVKQTEVKILNAKGDTVRQFKFNELKAGDNQISWNGEDERGQKSPAGNYSMQITATGANGQKVQPKTDFDGIVTGMSFSAEGPVLQIGKQAVRLKDIRQFSDPSLKSNDQKINDVTELDLKKQGQAQQTNIKQEEKSEQQKKAMTASTDDLLTQVGMESDLIDKVKQAMDKNATANTESKVEDKKVAPSEEGTL